MNLYQLTIHLSPKLSKKKSNDVQKEIKKEIEKQKGSFVNEGEIEKQSLAYPLLDNSQSLFWNLTIKLPSTKVEGLKSFLKEKENILRAMVVKTKEDKKPATPNQSRGSGSGQAPKESKHGSGQAPKESTAEPEQSTVHGKEHPSGQAAEGAEKSRSTEKKDKKTATTETQKKAEAQKEKESKVDIEDIDQKLDQILEEEM